MRARTLLRYGLAAAVLLAGTLGFAAYRVLRVEDVPDELPDVPAPDASPPPVLAGMGDLPPLDLGHPTARRTFVVVENQASMRSREGKRLHRALERWVLPEDVAGYIVGDAAGFGFLRDKIASMMGAWQKEMRFPVYLDFEGAVVERFGLPKGHSAIVVLDERGEVLFRHAGAADDEVVEKVRGLLGASEPPPGPPAPSFQLGELSADACKGRHCIVAFVGVPLARNQIPFVEGGADLEAMGKDAMTYMQRPEIRLATTLVRLPLPEGTGAAIVGTLDGLDEELEGWHVVPSAPEVAAAFGVEPGTTALFVIDPEGRIAIAEKGAFPAYRMGRLEDVLGVELPRGPAKDE
ncbi:MAG: hypothetical protein D6705_01265 [Deltaproteobacteria bacterium]|nr:MAG: hypothetical protein D6705_01265 [Deltaproteobacteria bacterium]